ncbi:MAG: flippase-like domain-containing protein [Magnetococcales bacterium]|nr:flippase-like domain-containing protein [Magnetococcales bacterium]
MKPSPWRRLLPLLKLLATVGLIGLLWYQGKLDFSTLMLISSSPGTILLVIGASMIGYSLVAVRWVLLLHSQHIPLPFAWGHRVTYLGLYCNLVLPGGGMAGDALRLAHAIRAAPTHRLEALLSLFVDRAVGLYAMLLIAMLAIFVNPHLVMGIGPLQLMAVAVIAAVFGIPLSVLIFYLLVNRVRETPWFVRFLQSGRVGRLTGRLVEIIRLYHHAWPRLLLALGITLVCQMLLLWALVLVANGLSMGTLTPGEYTFATPWAWIANFLPLTPGGIGVGEAAFDQVCRWIETTPSGAPYGTIFLVFRLLTMLGTFPGLVIFFFSRKEVQEAIGQRDPA